MAGELGGDFATGKTCYFLLRAAVDTIYNGAAFAAYLSANYASYPIAAMEQGPNTAGFYVGNMPAVAAGTYNVVMKQQIGGSPAETDPTVGVGNIYWDGVLVTILLSPTLAIPVTGNTANTVADCLNAARAQGFGVWKIVSTTLTLYAPDGVTVVRTFTLDSSTAPTQRV